MRPRPLRFDRSAASSAAPGGAVRPLRRAHSLTRAGAVLVPFAAAGLLACWLAGGLIGLFTATLVALIGLALLVGRLHLRALEIVPPPPGRVTAGGTVELALVLVNRARFVTARDLALTWSDEPLPSSRAAAFVLALSPGEELRVKAPWRMLARGRQRRLGLVVSSESPFGLVRTTLAFRLPVDLLGLPRLGRIADLRAFPTARPELSVERALAPRGEEAFWGVREWREGESLRGVHWRLSAHRGRLIRIETRPRQVPPVSLVLVTAVAAVFPARPHLVRFEGAIGLVATLTSHYLRARRAVRITIAGPESLAHASLSGRAGMLQLLVMLAEIAAVRGDPEAALARALAAAQGPAHGETVAVLSGDGRPRDPRARALVLDVASPATERVFRRGDASVLARVPRPTSDDESRRHAPPVEARRRPRSRGAAPRTMDLTGLPSGDAAAP